MLLTGLGLRSAHLPPLRLSALSEDLPWQLPGTSMQQGHQGDQEVGGAQQSGGEGASHVPRGAAPGARAVSWALHGVPHRILQVGEGMNSVQGESAVGAQMKVWNVQSLMLIPGDVVTLRGFSTVIHLA